MGAHGCQAPACGQHGGGGVQEGGGLGSLGGQAHSCHRACSGAHSQGHGRGADSWCEDDGGDNLASWVCMWLGCHSGALGSHRLGLDPGQTQPPGSHVLGCGTLAWVDGKLAWAHGRLAWVGGTLVHGEGLGGKLCGFQRSPQGKLHVLAWHILLLGPCKMEHGMQALVHGKLVWAHGKLVLEHGKLALVLHNEECDAQHGVHDGACGPCVDTSPCSTVACPD